MLRDCSQRYIPRRNDEQQQYEVKKSQPQQNRNEYPYAFGQTDEQFDAPVLYGSAKGGYFVNNLSDERKDCTPLLEKIIQAIPAPKDVSPDGTFQMLISNIDWDNYVGRVAIGKVTSGSVKKGDTLLIDDGKIQLEVKKVEDRVIFAEVLTDGLLKQRKGINIPGSQGSLDVLTERDIKFVEFAAKNDIDYLGLSFVRQASDVVKLRELLHDNGNTTARIISKIEKPQAVENIDSIIEVSDGIMVARGDLGIEISNEKVPIVQKTIIRKANAKRKVVIVATQMLDSMIENPIPTRAETSDVANAILDGTDAIMLSGETAAGAYPVEAVSMMKKIADNVEASPFMRKNKFPRKMIEEEKDSQAMAIGMSIADMTRKMDVKAAIALTGSGFTASMLAEAKLSVPIFACCPHKHICRDIKLYRGVYPIPLDFQASIDKKSLLELDKFLINGLGLEKGDYVVITGSVPELLVGGTNFIKIHKIGLLGE